MRVICPDPWIGPEHFQHLAESSPVEPSRDVRHLTSCWIGPGQEVFESLTKGADRVTLTRSDPRKANRPPKRRGYFVTVINPTRSQSETENPTTTISFLQPLGVGVCARPKAVGARTSALMGDPRLSCRTPWEIRACV